MKIFKYNPETGRRGEMIDSGALASWASTSVSFAIERGMIEPFDFVEPTGFGANAEVIVHIDAGRTDHQGNDISYQDKDQWLCFCLGEVMAGTDSYWSWVVLPPANLIKKAA